MRLTILNTLIIIWCMGIILTTGCSSSRTTSAPPQNLKIESTPTSIAEITSMPFNSEGKIAFVGFDESELHHQVYIMYADGSAVKNITPDLSGIGGLAWSPDGKIIAFNAIADGTTQIFTIKADGSDLQQLTFGDQDAFRPSWSPDGESIVFISSDKDILDDRGIVSSQVVVAQQIYVMNYDGTEIRRLIEDDKITISGTFRNDGFVSVSIPITRHSYQNYIVNSDGVIQQQFPELITDISPIWSPDSKYVILGSNAGCSGITIMSFNGLDKMCVEVDGVLTPPIYINATSWSPDGKQLMFSSNIDGDWDIYVIRTDGSGLTQLTNMPGNEGGAVWWGEP